MILDTYIDGVIKITPLGSLIKRGEHRMRVIAQFTDPATKQLVGRYSINVAVDVGNFGTALLSDPDIVLGEAFGEQLCRTAFGGDKPA